MLIISFFGIFLVFALVQFLANGLEIDKVKEGLCDKTKPKLSKDFNFVWATTATGKWYFPLQSKLDFYRSIEDLIPDKPLNTFTEEDTQKACFTMKFNKPTEVNINGFDGKQFQYVLNPTGENTIKFQAKKQNGVKGLRSSAYVTLSDNRNYIVFINCWEDGAKSWSVASLRKKLSEKATNKIKNHLKSIGFNMEHVHEGNYTGCDGNKKDENEL